MKFLLDENVPVGLLKSLSSHGIQAKHLLYTTLKGASDKSVFQYAQRNKMTIVTADKDFLHDAYFHRTHYGIILLKHLNRSADFNTIKILQLLKTNKSLRNKTVVIG